MSAAVEVAGAEYISDPVVRQSRNVPLQETLPRIKAVEESSVVAGVIKSATALSLETNLMTEAEASRVPLAFIAVVIQMQRFLAVR